jgi:hypothetical protein
MQKAVHPVVHVTSCRRATFVELFSCLLEHDGLLAVSGMMSGNLVEARRSLHDESRGVCSLQL